MGAEIGFANQKFSRAPSFLFQALLRPPVHLPCFIASVDLIRFSSFSILVSKIIVLDDQTEFIGANKYTAKIACTT